MKTETSVFAPNNLRELIASQIRNAIGDESPFLFVLPDPLDSLGDCQSYGELREHLVKHPHSQSPVLVAYWNQSASLDWLLEAAPWAERLLLPVTLGELRGRIKVASERRQTEQQWLPLVDLAFRTHLENQASIIRHSYRGIVAVVRLYIGSLICRASDPNCSEAVFREFQERARLQDMGANDKRIESLVAGISGYAKWARQTQERAEAIRAKGIRNLLNRRFLMFDDQVFEHGWNILFQELLHPQKTQFEGFSTPFLPAWKEFLASIKACRGSPATILLDCNLGKKAPTGLKVLSSIRHAYPEIPIVFLTAYDDAELALWALRAGATRFFAKQLHDINDRSSEKYFEHFLEEIDVGDSFELISKVWTRYSKLRAITGFSKEYSKLARKEFESVGVTSPQQRAREFFDCAFYLLFSYADGIRHWGLWPQGRGSLEAALVGQILLCIDQALPRRGQATREFRHRARLGQYEVNMETMVTLLRNRFQDLQGNEVEVELPSPKLPEGCLYDEDDLRTEGDTPGVEGTTRQSHEERSARAASELRMGLTNLGSASSQGSAEDVLIIDDRGENGWFDAFSGHWSNCRTSKSVNEILDDLGLQSSNCVVLNLHLPTLDDGLEALRSIKELSPGLPILVASATTDAPSVLKAMRSGAVDFISKSLSRPLGNEECLKFAESVSNKVEAARKLGQSRSRKWLDRANNWILRATPVSRECLQQMRKVNGRVSGHADGEMFEFPRSLNWKEAISDALRLFAFTYYQWRLSKTSKEFGNRVLLPLDAWRIEWFMPTEDGVVLRRLVMTASQIAEELGQMAWALETGRSFRRSHWGASDAWRQDAWLNSRATTNSIRITDALRKLSPDAMGLWELRIKGGGTPDGVAVALWNVVSQFEERLR